jgi:hypothetical protein
MAKPETLNLQQVRDRVEIWFGIKQQTAMLQKKLDQGKAQLKEIVQRYGQKDPESGSLFLDLGGLVSDQKIGTLKNQRRVTRSINTESAERILKRRRLWNQMTKQVTVIDQEAVAAAYFDNKITAEEFDQIFTEQVIYSLILLNDDEKPVS